VRCQKKRNIHASRSMRSAGAVCDACTRVAMRSALRIHVQEMQFDAGCCMEADTPSPLLDPVFIGASRREGGAMRFHPIST